MFYFFFSCPSHKVLPLYGTCLRPVRGSGQVFRRTRIVQQPAAEEMGHCLFRGGGALSVLLRSHTSLTASRQCSAFSSCWSARPTPVRCRLSERQQGHGWSDHAGRNSAGCNPILMTVHASCSRVFHISSLVLLGDEFSGFVKFSSPFRDFNRLIADMWLYSWCVVSAVCLDLSVRLATPDVRWSYASQQM